MTRDFILNKKSYDIDIATSATVKEMTTFLDGNVLSAHYGALKISKPPYNIDITTFRRELSYQKRNPTVCYIKDVKEDILRRDFTINAILMDKNGNIIDYLGGIQDIRNKKIKCIGNPNEKFQDDPLRMLRALRFHATLNFNIDNVTIAYKRFIRH